MIKITLSEFLELIKVVRMLYGKELAEALFDQNIDNYVRNYSTLSKQRNSLKMKGIT